MKNSVSSQNTIVAFYREYCWYHYLYFTTEKQWSKDLLSNKGVTTNQHTSIARVGVNAMIGIMYNDTQGINQ